MAAKMKVCYILPFYDEGTDTHLFYNYELIKKAARLVDIFVVIEKCQTLDVRQISQKLGARVYIQKFKFPPFRFFELFLKCFMLHVSGYRNFYIHYSYYGALVAWLTTWRWHRQVRVFYWNRGMPWLFKRGWFEEGVFKFILRRTILVTGPESLAKEYVKRYAVRKYRVLSNWVDVERFKPSDSPKAQIFQDLAQPGGASRAIRQQANMRVLEKFGAKANDGLEKLASESPNKRVVLFVHHLSKRKGADLVPEIAKGFGENVLFLMIGDGPEFENCKLKIENFGLKNVKLLGKLPNADLPAHFHASSVFLMPSREEGSPHVLLEAMASGIPFVASDVGGVRELVPSSLNQLLCKSEDVNCFQNKIRTLLSDSALYDKIRNAGLAHAKNFDISRGVREFIELFSE